ncbi:MAG TPA: hypothetical protein PKN13_12765 [Accumulibacter sp.]|nr:hypothetical protein [Accumulibacter sp.]HMW18552.1 hypothetical protein [Accumulibacter sp.]HMX23023.1 hypothetical protein [Accumulibacter sp.]HMY07805.1 hypothetical protein [Accumulibacter sp.]HNC18710.1 hypothetical protein [Accumulibacter sp.]
MGGYFGCAAAVEITIMAPAEWMSSEKDRGIPDGECLSDHQSLRCRLSIARLHEELAGAGKIIIANGN